MPSGRCDGCGKTGTVARVAAHIMECPDWQALYAASPALARDPEKAYAAWIAGGRTQAREERKVVLAERESAAHEQADLRWAVPKDILED